MPSIDLHIPTLLLALPASRAGLPERMSNIPGILGEPFLPGTDSQKSEAKKKEKRKRKSIGEVNLSQIE